MEVTGNVEFTGLRDLEPLEQTIVKGIAQEYLPVIQQHINNNFDLLVHVKAHNRTIDNDVDKVDKNTNYGIHIKLIFATKNIINVDRVADWDLPRGIHESFVALLNRVKKEFRQDANQYRTRKSIQKNEKQILRREFQVRNDKKKAKIRKQANKKRNSLV